MTTKAQAVFQLYANLLTKETLQPWVVIVKEQTDSLPYTDIFGVKQRKSLGKTTKSFKTCLLLHLQPCFLHDTGENLRFYTLNCLKKPDKVSIQQIVQHVLKLNNYIEALPCLFYSSSAS